VSALRSFTQLINTFFPEVIMNTWNRFLLALLFLSPSHWLHGASESIGTGLTGCYYNNETFTGIPAFVRLDEEINFSWPATSPGSPLNSDHFSVRWMGYLQTPATEDLTLIARTDDGVRLWIDDVLVINAWVSRTATDSVYVFSATAGRKYHLKMEYFDRTGRASANLAWQSGAMVRQTIPTSALFPMPEVIAALPTSSPVSPAFIEGLFLPIQQPTIIAAGKRVTISSTDDTHYYANIPLSEQATSTTVASGSTEYTSAIAWKPTTVSDELNIVIRAGDALRLRSPVSGQLRFTLNCGVERPDVPVIANKAVKTTFNQPGWYRVYAEDSIGTVVGVGTITVVAADLRGPIPCEIGFTRGKDVTVSNTQQVVIASSHPELVSITSNTPSTQGESRIGLQAISFGHASLTARLGGPTGPIISAAPFALFALNAKGRSGIVVNDESSTGSDQLTMRPFVSNVSFSLRMNAHHATFAGGTTTLSFNSNAFTVVTDPITHETYGYKVYDIELPANEDAFCYRLKVFEQTDDLESLNDQQINGTDCRLEVKQIFFLKGISKVKTLPVTCIKKGTRHHPHPVTILGGTPPTVDSGSPINCPGDNMPIDPPVMVRNTAGVPVGKYTVDIDGTQFPEMVIVWDMELHTAQNALVVADKKLYVDPTPAMPVMIANLIPAGLPDTADWTETFVYKRFLTDPSPDVYHPMGNPIAASANWDINQTMGAAFRGGDVELVVVYQGDTKRLPFKVLGHNATRAVAEAFLLAQTPPPYASAIITHETSWKQFNEGTRTFNEEPNYDGEKNGWGIGQLDPPPGKQYLWNWKENLTEAANRMKQNQVEANDWIAGQVAQQIQADPGKPLAAATFVFGGVTYKSGTTRTPEYACGIGRYNGAKPWPVAWNRPSAPGVWSGQDNKNGYVGIISTIWGQ
jgi:PA14 domain